MKWMTLLEKIIQFLDRYIFNLPVMIGSLLLAMVLLGSTVGFLWLTRSEGPRTGEATAALTIIPAPTFTPISPTPTPQLDSTPTSNLPPSPPPGTITVGAYVQINGTGGDGLRLREGPSLNSPVRLLGAEAEVFQVNQGPQEADGFIWWYLVGPYDQARQGWAVSNYLAVVQGP